MKQKTRFFATLRQLSTVALVAAVFVAFPVASNAQEQTSSIRGSITGSDGSPVAAASIAVVDTRTGTRRSTSTNTTGTFTASALKIGGPYRIEIVSAGHANQTITDVFVTLGETYTFSIQLSEETIEEITVTASMIDTVQVALGPSAVFTIEDLNTAPAINRDITDVVRMDSRMHVSESGNRGDEIHCGGAHNRFNSLTVDGVRLNDQFGLNSNGYPTARMPFSYDAIQQVAIEMAPFDVQYGGFTACNINAVTKSGTNEFHGSVFYDYTDDGLTGSTLESDPVDLGKWEENRSGFNVGGPIVRDKLFFFVAYEYFDGAEKFARGPADSPSAGTFVQGVTAAQLARIKQVAEDVYGYDPGEAVRTLPVDDEKILARIDWNINDDHRANFTYMWNDGFNIAESDGDNNEFEFSNHYYERGAELTSYVGQVFSNWTDNFSTEFRVSSNDLVNRQINIGDNDFGEVQIRTWNNGTRATVYLGADDSRHTNRLNWDTLGYKLTGEYRLGTHTISAGWERDELEVFNLFVQETEGEYEFESGCGSSSNPDGCIDAFESGNPDDIVYKNSAGTNIPEDSGVTWGYEINTLYLQDEFPLFDDRLSIVAGLRYDWYTSSSLPQENPFFFDRNGYTNADNFDGESLWQPRIGFSFEATDDINIHGGVGLYSGGNPNVWLSNNYSNTGLLTVRSTERDLEGGALTPGIPGNGPGPDLRNLFTIPTEGDGRPIWNVPTDMFNTVASSPDNDGVNAIDPAFKIPSAWKYALGAVWHKDFDNFLGDQWTFSADFQYSEGQDDAIIVDATLEPIGTAPDGRPIYKNIDRADRGDGVTDFGCYTDATYSTLDPTSPNCGNRRFAQDFILSNVKSGNSEQRTFSLGISKSHDWGLDWTLAWTNTKSEDVSPMTSFVAFSNYASIAVSDPNDPGQARSNYEFADRIIFRARYQKAFFGDYRTRFSLFAARNSGRPYSATFAEGGGAFGGGFGDGIDDRHLLYVPTANDPGVIYGPEFDQAAFQAFLDESGLRAYEGRTIPRNSFTSDWWTKVDIRIEQELPGFSPDHRFSAFLYIENIGNLLNDDWGVLYEASFPRYQGVVDVSVDPDGPFTFNEFIRPDGQGRAADASLYEIRFGVNYSF
jgi:hypothetical protein